MKDVSRALGRQILPEGAAQRDVDQLCAPADREYRQAVGSCGVHESELEGVALRAGRLEVNGRVAPYSDGSMSSPPVSSRPAIPQGAARLRCGKVRGRNQRHYAVGDQRADVRGPHAGLFLRAASGACCADQDSRLHHFLSESGEHNAVRVFIHAGLGFDAEQRCGHGTEVDRAELGRRLDGRALIEHDAAGVPSGLVTSTAKPSTKLVGGLPSTPTRSSESASEDLPMTLE